MKLIKKAAILAMFATAVISCSKEDAYVGTKWVSEVAWDTEDLGYDLFTREEKLFPVHIVTHESITFNNDKYLAFSYWNSASYDRTTCEMHTGHWKAGDISGKYKYYIKGNNLNIVFSETDAPYVIKIERGALYDALTDMRMTKQ